jgi:hypothetical protein
LFFSNKGLKLNALKAYKVKEKPLMPAGNMPKNLDSTVLFLQYAIQVPIKKNMTNSWQEVTISDFVTVPDTILPVIFIRMRMLSSMHSVKYSKKTFR